MMDRSSATAVRAARTLAATLLAGIGLTACGEADGGDRGPVSTDDPAKAFAPLVRLAESERSFPEGALFFLEHAGLEWAGGPCGFEHDITPSGERDPGESSPLPPLVPARLGREPGAYRFRPEYQGCDRARPEVFTTAQRTRPFDTEDRPAGLHLDEGFNLDLSREAEPGQRTLDPDGSLAVPAYYAVERTREDGEPVMRIGYWILFGQEESSDSRDALVLREGDWERIDVVAEPGPGRGRYTPRAVEYRIGDRTERVAWEDVELADGDHPIAYLDGGRHTPRPTGECDDCTEWRTWRRLRDVRAEPWWGYGGGWGRYGPEDEFSGSSGPSPFEAGGPSPSPRTP